MAVLGVVSLLVSRGLQGSSWAMGVTVALVALVFAFLTYAAVFGLVFAVSTVFNRRPLSSRRTPAQPPLAEVASPSPPRDNTNLVPPAVSESL